MKAKHTKGKWFVNPRSTRNVRCGDNTIANCSQGQDGDNEEEEIANAKLIAAAPDLLDALLKLQYAVKHGGVKGLFEDEKKLIDNAINKAIGE